MLRNPFAFTGITLVIALILFFFLMTMKPDHDVSRWIFNLLPFDVVHDLGLYIFIFIGIITAFGLYKMLKGIRKRKTGKVQGLSAGLVKILKAIIKKANKIMTMNRYKECDRQDDAYWAPKLCFLKPWFIHWMIMMGFLGLLLATILDLF